MQKKLTITIDEDVYSGLHQIVGRRKISRFIESLVRPYVIYGDLQEGYRQMAADTEREAEAMEWIEGTAEISVMKRGEVWWVRFGPSVGGEIRKQRPAVVVTNDVALAI